MNSLNFYSINPKGFRTVFYSVVTANIVIVTVSFVLIKIGFRLIPGLKLERNVIMIAMYAMVGLAAAHTLYGKKMLKQIYDIQEFESRINAYEKVYRFRLFWYLFSGIITCLIAVITGAMVFFYFGLVDIFLTLPYYPSLRLFRTELRNPEIVFS
jgi:hypothetical protein